VVSCISLNSDAFLVKMLLKSKNVRLFFFNTESNKPKLIFATVSSYRLADFFFFFLPYQFMMLQIHFLGKKTKPWHLLKFDFVKHW